MYQDVDVIGSDQVVKLIQQSKLQKFMIYRKGSGKGSIPVFECIGSQSVNQACKAFQDWAQSALNLNPHNILPYEILLYNKNASDQDLENDARYEMNAPKDELNASRRKENKIKFSFALNGVHGGQFPGYNNPMGGLNVEAEVARALDKFKMELKLKELQDENRRLREGDDDDDDDDAGSGLLRVTNLLKEIRLSGKKKAGAIAGDEDDFDDLDDDDDDDDLDDDDDDSGDDSREDDDDDDDDDDSEEEEEEERTTRRSTKSKPSKQSRVTEQRKRLKNALRILMKKDKRLIPHLEKLAKLSRQNPAMFKTVLTNLDALNI